MPIGASPISQNAFSPFSTILWSRLQSAFYSGVTVESTAAFFLFGF
jgi:hypothetical protein